MPMIRQAQTPFLHCVLTAKTNKQQTSKWTKIRNVVLYNFVNFIYLRINHSA